MAVTETCSNGWREPQRDGDEGAPPAARDERSSGWSDAESIGGELESWLEAFTGRRGDEVLDLGDPSATLQASERNNWREPLDEVGGETEV